MEISCLLLLRLTAVLAVILAPLLSSLKDLLPRMFSCEYAIFHSLTDCRLEFQKPLGSGADIWPPSPVSYSWSLTCASTDDLARWFQVPANRDAFAHVSHTFAHESLNNATYADANREIFFNKQWMSQVGIASASKFSPSCLIPPAITGLHNGDAIKAFMDNGITAVVGDNTRPVLKNKVRTEELSKLCSKY